MQLGFVAGDQAFDVGVAAGSVDRREDLTFVVVETPVEPDAEGEAQTGSLSQPGQFGKLGSAVGAQPVGTGRQQLHVGGEFRAAREALCQRAFPALEGVVGQPLDARRGVRHRQGRIEKLPDGKIEQHDQYC